MTIRAGSLDRRTLLRGAIATAAVGSFAVACSSPSGKDGDGDSGPKGEKSATNPFGVAANSTVEAAIFDGGYGTDYVDYTNQVLGGQVKGLKVKVEPVVDIAPSSSPASSAATRRTSSTTPVRTRSASSASSTSWRSSTTSSRPTPTRARRSPTSSTPASRPPARSGTSSSRSTT